MPQDSLNKIAVPLAFNEPRCHIFFMGFALVLLWASAFTLILVGWHEPAQSILLPAGLLMLVCGLVLARHLRCRKRLRPMFIFDQQQFCFINNSFLSPHHQSLAWRQIESWRANNSMSQLTIQCRHQDQQKSSKPIIIPIGMLAKRDRQQIIALLSEQIASND